jgi:transcriptional regulator with XRE-family HTH domain
MLTRMGLEETMHYGRISEYEQGKREPTLMTLLAYARAASVHLEDIVDDEFDLPRKLPGNVNYRGLSKRASTRRK